MSCENYQPSQPVTNPVPTQSSHRTGTYREQSARSQNSRKSAGQTSVEDQQKTLEELCRISNLLAQNSRRGQQESQRNDNGILNPMVHTTADNSSKELFAPIDVNQVLMKQKQRTATNVD